jgi:DNA-binding NarL/FixJ family response regulator
MIRILLADDHQMVRQGIAALLEGQPELEIVGQVPDGKAAVELVRSLEPDVAIIDLAMPKLNGLQAAEKIQAVSPTTKILLLSMFEDEEYILKATQAGVSGYLLKGELAEELLEAIELISKQSRFYLSRAITNRWLLRQLGEGRLPRRLLTPREREVLELIAVGFSNREIGARLGISVKTVESHRGSLMEKLGVHTAAGLVKYALSKPPVER